MPQLEKAWLEPFDWGFVTEVNRGLCRQKNALHKPSSDGHARARELWEQSRLKEPLFLKPSKFVFDVIAMRLSAFITAIRLLPSQEILFRMILQRSRMTKLKFSAVSPATSLPEPPRTSK